MSVYMGAISSSLVTKWRSINVQLFDLCDIIQPCNRLTYRVSRDCLIEIAFVDVSPIKFLLMRNQMLATFGNFIHVKDYFAYIHVNYFWFVHIEMYYCKLKAFS